MDFSVSIDDVWHQPMADDSFYTLKKGAPFLVVVGGLYREGHQPVHSIIYIIDFH